MFLDHNQYYSEFVIDQQCNPLYDYKENCHVEQFLLSTLSLTTFNIWIIFSTLSE